MCILALNLNYTTVLPLQALLIHIVLLTALEEPTAVTGVLSPALELQIKKSQLTDTSAPKLQQVHDFFFHQSKQHAVTSFESKHKQALPREQYKSKNLLLASYEVAQHLCLLK